MINPNEAYRDLAEWVDVSGHPDKAQFDALLSIVVESVMNRTIIESVQKADSGSHAIQLIEEYMGEKKYEQFFTVD